MPQPNGTTHDTPKHAPPHGPNHLISELQQCVRWILASAVLSLATALGAQPAFQMEGEVPKPDRYLTGGSKPLSPEAQAILDRNADIIGLGINTDWIGQAWVLSGPYVEGMNLVATAVRSGRTPGAVVYLSRAWGEMFPVAIGCMMVDPHRIKATYSTQYDLGELAGYVTAVPITLKAIERGDLHLDQNLGELLPEVAGAGKAPITIGELLRHSSGLPGSVNLPGRITNRERAIRFLNELEPVAPHGQASQPSRLNHLMLGLILEAKYATPFQELAEQEIFIPFGMANTTFHPPAHWRQTIAPGPYLEWLGRMAWGEPSDELTRALGRSGASSGLFTSADDMGLFARKLLPGMGVEDSYLTTETLRLIRVPDTRDPGMGLGYRLGGFTPMSLGADGSEGCSLWLDPTVYAFVVYLSNENHPVDRGPTVSPLRGEVFARLRDSLEPLPAPVGLTPPAPGPEGAAPTPHHDHRQEPP